MIKKSKLERYHLFGMDEIITYMENTKEESWCINVVRSGKTNCFFGHLHAMCKDDGEATFNWDMFEEQWATTYMIYPVNDGEHPGYKQNTPKQRVIAYLKNLLDGKEKTTWDLIQ